MFRALSYLYMARLVVGGLLLLTVVVSAGVGQYVWHSRQDTLAQRLREAEMQARMFEDQLTQMLNLTNLTLQGLADNLDAADNPQALNDTLSQTVRRLVFLRSISSVPVAGGVSSGRVTASSTLSNLGVDVADDDWLPARGDAKVANFLRLGVPRTGRDLSEGVVPARHQTLAADAQTFFPVVREEAWQGQTVRFVGVINTDYFINAMATHIDPQLTRVDVWRYDGVLLFSSAEAALPAQRTVSAELMRFLREREIGVDTERNMAFRTSRSFPLFVVVRVDPTQALLPWRSNAQQIVGTLLASLLVLWALGGLLIQRIRRNLAAEQSLQETRSLAARVFEDSSNGILIADGQCRIVALNAKFERNTGYTRHDMLGMDLQEYVTHALGPTAVAEVSQALAAQGVWRGELVEVKPNGERIHQWLTLSVVRNSEAQVIHYVGVFEDLTEERRRDGQIRRLSQAIEQSPTSILITDLEAVIEYVNPHFLRTTGYGLSEVIGQKPSILRSGLTPDATFRDLWDTLLQGRVWEGELINRHRDGQVCYQRAVISPIRDAQGHVTGYVAVELDVTQQRLQSLQLDKARRDAEAASVAKSNFLANMSHEIRTPMNGIIGISELMLSLPKEATWREQVQTIHNSARSLLGIINDILDFSKIEANKMPLERLPFSPTELLQDLFNLMRPAALERALTLRFESHPTDLPVLVGDPSRVRQILLNLLGNAIKFTSEGEVRLDVALTPVSSDTVSLRFSVTDTGIGMPPPVMDNLFTPFYQGDASMTRRFGGTGLGLSISHRLAQLMGGDLRATSVVGQGSTFVLQVPLGLASPEQSAQLAPPTAALPSGLKVLLVEDNPVNRQVAQALLMRLSCEVTTVNDGVEALACLPTQSFDVILMDCQMPNMDGFEATRLIRRGEAGKTAQATRIIAMTAHAMQGDREACLAAGMNDYIAKPVSLTQLRQVMGRQLAG
jgi:PAS domain S-box-containing protein